MASLHDRPYLFGVELATEEDIQEAHYEVFASAAGQRVLDSWYWRVMMREPDDLRQVGQQDFFRYVIQTIQLGWNLKQHGRPHGRTNDHDSPGPWE